MVATPLSRPSVVALVVVLVVSAVAPAVAADTERATLDAETGLTDADTIDRYESEEMVSTTTAAPAMRLTIAEDHDDVGLNGVYLDIDKAYLRVQYNESIERTVRFYVPSEYWYPIVAEQDAVNADVTAEMAPTDDGRYTAATVQFDGETDAVFPVPKEASRVVWGRDQSRDIVENSTGYEPPSLGSSGTWQYVPEDQLDGASSYPLNESGGLTVQYDADRSSAEEWISVPECGESDAPVCTYRKQGVDDRVYVLSRTDDAPDVRFKETDDVRAEGRSIVRELGRIPGEFLEDIRGGLFGGAD
jgi:hypothetical protein